jgi:hypothetical protein
MPTQTEFERAAGEFDRSAAHVDELFDGPRRLLDGGVLVGGLLTLELHQLFDHVHGALARRADELRDLAATCRNRAAACAAHQAVLQVFDTATDVYEGDRRQWMLRADAHDQEPHRFPSPGPAPRPPEAPLAPPDWISVGSDR